MANEENKEAAAETSVEGEEKAPKKSKKTLFLGGGALGVVATAAAVSLLAVPGADEVPVFEGPFVMDLAALEEGQALTANLAGEGGRRYLVIDLKVEFDAYEETYGLARIADPLYIAKLQDTLLTIASQRSAEDVLDRATQEVFLGELETAAEYLLFPVHTGKALTPTGPDEKSGIRPGVAAHKSTMRDPFHDGKLFVDTVEKKLRLNGGDEYTFNGNEDNLVVKDEQGRTLYVDVTGLKEGFVGEINVGIRGHIRELYKVKFIIQ